MMECRIDYLTNLFLELNLTIQCPPLIYYQKSCDVRHTQKNDTLFVLGTVFTGVIPSFIKLLEMLSVRIQ